MKFTELAKRRPSLVISLVLGLVTFALYTPILHNGFVNYDDQGYITDNAHVTKGLSWPGVVWAFKSSEQGNWHPLTWISHMVDCDLFGLNPAGHHFTNVLFHTANTLLLFFLLRQMTGRIWPSAFVAALFGWHPLHVESVAWASEQKDVLCAFFWLLTMMVYVKYVRQPRAGAYLLALVLFAGALMSKPMAVTLPCTLLLLDFWPLNRLEPATALPGSSGGFWRRVVFLVAEKLPFFALAIADSGVTFLAQKSSGAVLSAAALPFSYRLANALWSYLRYISDTLCPAGLAIIYPYRAHLPAALVSISIGLLVVWSGLFVWWRKRYPYLLTGWFWFLGTLVPAIGLVQVGAQSMADRYMYIPSIGLFILVVWGASEVMQSRPQIQNIFQFAGALALAACLAITSVQLRYWRDTITLFTHAIEVTGDNSVAYFCLGLGYEKEGDLPDALTLYKKSVQLGPDYFPAQFGLGRVLLANGDYAEAKPCFDYAERLDAHDAQLEFDLGVALLKAGKNAEGIEHLRTAAQMEPDNPKPHCYLGFALEKTTNTDQAALEFTNALRLQPDYPDARYGLAAWLTAAGRTNEALAQYQDEVNRHGNDPEAHYNLGLALQDNRQFAGAETEFQQELQLAPAELKAHYRLAQVLAGEAKFAEAAAQYRETLQLMPGFSDGKKELDALLAAHPELK